MGGLGWSPRQFWDEATFLDVCAAVDGFLLVNGVAEKQAAKKDYPSKKELNDLMERFPDVGK